MSNNMTFEAAMAELENTVKKLESGSMSLDESLLEFEKAVKLVKICNDKLEVAEQRVRILTEGIDGIVTDIPFNCEDAN